MVGHCAKVIIDGVSEGGVKDVSVQGPVCMLETVVGQKSLGARDKF